MAKKKEKKLQREAIRRLSSLKKGNNFKNFIQDTAKIFSYMGWKWAGTDLKNDQVPNIEHIKQTSEHLINTVIKLIKSAKDDKELDNNYHYYAETGRIRCECSFMEDGYIETHLFLKSPYIFDEMEEDNDD